MKRIVLFMFFLGIGWAAQAQFNMFNPIPKRVNIDLADMKKPAYKARLKQYKDTLKYLGGLEKQKLLDAKEVYKELPGVGKQKMKLKNLESGLPDYKAKVEEIDSLKRVLKVCEAKATKLDSLRKLNFHVKRSDGLEYYRTDWRELVDTVSGQGNAKIYTAQHENAETDSSAILATQIRKLMEQNFGSHENYLQGKAKLGEIESLIAQAKTYRDGMAELIKGNLEPDKISSALEARAMKIAGMRELAAKKGELESYEAKLRQQVEEMRYKADLESHYKKHLQKQGDQDIVNEVMMKGKALAGNHFKGHEKELLAAQKSLNGLKTGVFNKGNAENMEIIRSNSLKGKPLGERLVLGGNLQMNREDSYTGIDFSPSLGYRWNKKYIWGIGGTYRAKLLVDEKSLLKDEQVYGGRFYMEYSISKFFVHGEYEQISHAVVMDAATDQVSRVNSPGALLGAGMNYSFSKGVKGNMMILYNFLHDDETSPYKQPFVYRVGFNWGK